MANFSDWSTGAKLITLSLVCLLLAIGLCGSSAYLRGGIAAENFRFGAGLIALGLALLLFVAAIVAFIVAGMKRNGDR